MEWEVMVRDGLVLCWCGGGFIHLFPLWVEWFGLVERCYLPSFLSAEEHMGCSPLLHFIPLYAFLALQVDLLSLSQVQTHLNCSSSSHGTLCCYALLDLVLLIMAIFISEENVHFAH